MIRTLSKSQTGLPFTVRYDFVDNIYTEKSRTYTAYNSANSIMGQFTIDKMFNVSNEIKYEDGLEKVEEIIITELKRQRVSQLRREISEKLNNARYVK